jgi:hypothetical protein
VRLLPPLAYRKITSVTAVAATENVNNGLRLFLILEPELCWTSEADLTRDFARLSRRRDAVEIAATDFDTVDRTVAIVFVERLRDTFSRTVVERNQLSVRSQYACTPRRTEPRD